jgi:hypothetical protein
VAGAGLNDGRSSANGRSRVVVIANVPR